MKKVYMSAHHSPLTILVNAPDKGTASQYIAHAVDTNTHSDFVQFLHNMPSGVLHFEKFNFTHELMTLLRVPLSPEEYQKHTLLKLPHLMPQNNRDHKVCALLRRENISSESCVLQALILLFKDLQDVNKVQVILLPNSSCNLLDSAKLPKHQLKKDQWRRVLNRLKISPSDIVHDAHAILQAKQEASLLAAGYSLQLVQPEQMQQRFSHMPLTLVTETMNTSLNVCKINLRERLHALLNQYVTACKKTGVATVKGITETIAVSEDHCIHIEVEHMARLCCTLKSVHDAAIISSTTVNFAKQMVYATFLAPQYTTVFGLQKIALLAATKLQSALTPHLIANYVLPTDTVSKRLIQLMLSKDLYDEIRNINAHGMQRVTDFVLTKHVSFEEKARLQQHIFQNSTFLSQKRLRTSTATLNSQKADRCAWMGLHDKFCTLKMIAARGVATAQLFCIKQQLCIPENVYAHFSNICTARIMQRSMVINEPIAKRTYMMWHEPSSIAAMSDVAVTSDLESWTSANFIAANPISDPQFFFTQSQFPALRELCVYRQQDGKNASIAVFKDDAVLLALASSDCKDVDAPLISALLDCCESNSKSFNSTTVTSTLYRKALINLIFRTLLQHKSKQVNYASWIDHFRGEWLQNHYQPEPVSETEANKLYLEYSLFSECLRRNIQGLQIPADVFSVVVQEVLPFPCV